MDAKKILGANVKKYRELRGLSQEKLAEASGLHRTYVSGVERGIRNATVTIIEKLAKALSVSPSELLANSSCTEQARKGVQL